MLDLYNFTEVNNFQIVSQFISFLPMFFFAAIGGGFSDVLGRKPLLFWPVFGYLVVNLLGIVEELFLETIPLEFFYVENISSFFGGSAVFYLVSYYSRILEIIH